MAYTSTKFLSSRSRVFSILAGMLLFLPPFALLPQLVGEVNMCGVVCPRMFFTLPAGGLSAGFGRAITAEWAGAGLVALILAVTFFLGRLWCGRLCPIGGSTELASRLVPGKVKINFAGLHAPGFRYAYFFIFVTGAWLGLGAIACKFCNFRVIPFLFGSAWVPGYRAYLLSSAGVAGLLTVSLAGVFSRGGRAYCNLLCPVGTLDGIVNHFSSKLLFTRKVRTDLGRCNGCGACVSSCMVWALEVGGDRKIRRDQTSCMSCGECLGACPREASRYGKL